MPTSYQAPMRQDRQAESSKSQTVSISRADPGVSDVLADKNGDVFSVRPEQKIRSAVEILRDKRIGALVVTGDEGALVGILSERDIVRKLAEMPGETLPLTVHSVMTKDVETCSSSDSLVSVLQRMTDGRYRHMPVVEKGRLVGMVTIGDVVNYRLRQLEQEALQLKQLIVG